MAATPRQQEGRVGEAAGAPGHHRPAADEDRDADDQQQHGDAAEQPAHAVGGPGHALLALPPQLVGLGGEDVVGLGPGLVEVGGADREALAGVGPRGLDQPGVADQAVAEGVDQLLVVVGGGQPRLGQGLGRQQDLLVVGGPLRGGLQAAGDEGAGGQGVGVGQVGAEVGGRLGHAQAVVAGVRDRVGVAGRDGGGGHAAEDERGPGQHGEGEEEATARERDPPGQAFDPAEDGPRRRDGRGGCRQGSRP